MIYRGKIPTFESNSQLDNALFHASDGCSEYQRYQLLKAIHNALYLYLFCSTGCSEYQRYQLLKAIHN